MVILPWIGNRSPLSRRWKLDIRTAGSPGEPCPKVGPRGRPALRSSAKAAQGGSGNILGKFEFFDGSLIEFQGGFHGIIHGHLKGFDGMYLALKRG